MNPTYQELIKKKKSKLEKDYRKVAVLTSLCVLIGSVVLSILFGFFEGATTVDKWIGFLFSGIVSGSIALCLIRFLLYVSFKEQEKMVVEETKSETKLHTYFDMRDEVIVSIKEIKRSFNDLHRAELYKVETAHSHYLVEIKSENILIYSYENQ